MIRLYIYLQLNPGGSGERAFVRDHLNNLPKQTDVYKTYQETL